ncbi:MAG: glycosyltransferase [Bacteroidetes bacterium]|nr:glycosyltransferase [Bacteroidota bacterium]
MIQPDVSILMTVFNGEKYLSHTIESVLGQSLREFEFIIIDDGSTDSTPEIIASFRDPRIICFTQANKGVAAASNKGLSMAKGRYIARIDADDTCMKDRIRLQYDFLENNPGYVLCGSTAEMTDMDGNYIFTSSLPLEDEDIRKVLEKENCFVHSSTFFRKEVALKIGGYNEAVKLYFNDYIFLYQLTRLGKARNFRQPLVRYRMVPSSISLKIRDAKFRSLLKEIVRRGTAGEEELLYFINFEKTHNLDKTDKAFNYYITLSKLYRIESGNWKMSVHYLYLAFQLKPFALSFMSSAIIQIMMPRTFVRKIRKNFY